MTETSPGFTPPSDCDKDTVHGNRIELWEAAQLKPDLAHLGYVFLGGDIFFKFNKDTNKLLVPKFRITGIECPKVLDTTLPNYWQAAWDEARKSFGKNVDILVGINSYDGRTQDQLHIHLTAFIREARTQLDKIDSTIPRNDLRKWNDQIFELGAPGDTYVYRIAHVDALDRTNPFILLNHFVVSTSNDMFAQSLAVVAAKNGGHFLIATQGKKTQANQPDHPKPLHIGTYWGTSTVEALMDRRGK